MSATHTTHERTLDESILPPCLIKRTRKGSLSGGRRSRGNARGAQNAEALRSLAGQPRKPGPFPRERLSPPLSQRNGPGPEKLGVRGRYLGSFALLKALRAPSVIHDGWLERLDALLTTTMNLASTLKPHREEGPHRSEAGCLLSPQNSIRLVNPANRVSSPVARRPEDPRATGLPTPLVPPCCPEP